MDSKFILKKPYRFNGIIFAKGTVLRNVHQNQYYVQFSDGFEEIMLTYDEVNEYIGKIKSKYTKEDYLSLLQTLSEKDNLENIVLMVGLDKLDIESMFKELQEMIR